MATNQRRDALDTPDILCMLTSKPLSGTKKMWNREVLKIRRQQHREPNLEDFTKYVEDEAILIRCSHDKHFQNIFQNQNAH